MVSAVNFQMAAAAKAQADSPAYLETELITYIGNKRSLLPFIGPAVEQVKTRLGRGKLTFLDLFSGSGVVSRYMKPHAEAIVANDIEGYARIVNGCYLANRSHVDFSALAAHLAEVEAAIKNDWRRGFIAELYAPLDDAQVQPGERVFYTRRNAEYIDSARQHLKRVPLPERNFLLAPLLVKSSIHANTGGVFKGFYKNRQGIGAFGGEAGNALKRICGDIALHLPTLSCYECAVEVRQDDALTFCQNDPRVFDLAYLDPPYNQHPYGSNYFMLNLIAEYQRPERISSVSGIPEDWTRSPFNKAGQAKDAFFAVVEALKARFVLISYNSEGFIQKDEFLEGLQRFGRVETLETAYNAYRASRNLMGRSAYVTEYLFLLEKK